MLWRRRARQLSVVVDDFDVVGVGVQDDPRVSRRRRKDLAVALILLGATQGGGVLLEAEG
jgi:hypothetical protein